MNIKEALVDAQVALCSGDSAVLDSQVLLAHAMRKSRSYVIAFDEVELGDEEITSFTRLVQRRAQGEPVAYLTGQAEFWSLLFKVTADTLVPRADTEVLVEQALNILRHQPDSKVLDLGTGTGAIACAIAHEMPQAQVVAVEASPTALLVARENVRHLNLKNVSAIQSDWFANVTGQFDIIVSNPPYISAEDSHLSGDGVRFEPKRALVADNQGLSEIQIIAQQAPRYLIEGGWLMVEHGFEQAPEVQMVFEKSGLGAIETIKDYAGNPRVTIGNKR